MTKMLSQLKINEGQAKQIRKEDLPIEQEIECPRCLDIMTLKSEFDMLGYYCEDTIVKNAAFHFI
jgi:hypothetical protein